MKINQYNYRPSLVFYKLPQEEYPQERRYSNRGIPVFDKANFNSYKTPYYGIELEYEYVGKEPISIQSMLWNFSNKIVENGFYIKMDGSLQNGIELVSHPRTYNSWLANYKNIRDLMNFLVHKDIRGNSGRCGLHIHIGTDAFASNMHIFKFLKLIYFMQNVLYAMSKRSKESIAEYAIPSKWLFDLYCNYLGTANMVINGSNVPKMLLDLYHMTQYGKYHRNEHHHAINFTGETIEIRHFTSTNSAYNLYAYLQILESLRLYTFQNGMTHCTLDRYMKWLGTTEYKLANLKLKTVLNKNKIPIFKLAKYSQSLKSGLDAYRTATAEGGGSISIGLPSKVKKYNHEPYSELQPVGVDKITFSQYINKLYNGVIIHKDSDFKKLWNISTKLYGIHRTNNEKVFRNNYYNYGNDRLIIIKKLFDDIVLGTNGNQYLCPGHIRGYYEDLIRGAVPTDPGSQVDNTYKLITSLYASHFGVKLSIPITNVIKYFNMEAIPPLSVLYYLNCIYGQYIDGSENWARYIIGNLNTFSTLVMTFLSGLAVGGAEDIRDVYNSIYAQILSSLSPRDTRPYKNYCIGWSTFIVDKLNMANSHGRYTNEQMYSKSYMANSLIGSNPDARYMDPLDEDMERSRERNGGRDNSGDIDVDEDGDPIGPLDGPDENQPLDDDRIVPPRQEDINRLSRLTWENFGAQGGSVIIPGLGESAILNPNPENPGWYIADGANSLVAAPNSGTYSFRIRTSATSATDQYR